MVAASTGITPSSRKAVISQVQQNSGIFISVMPGARMFRMVTMMLIAPMMDDAPMMCSANIAMSMPGPICTDSGAYSVQPAAVAPPGTKNEAVSRIAAIGRIQKLRLFIRANAMSGGTHLQRDHPVGEAHEGRHDGAEHHDQAVHGGELVEELGLEELRCRARTARCAAGAPACRLPAA